MSAVKVKWTRERWSRVGCVYTDNYGKYEIYKFTTTNGECDWWIFPQDGSPVEIEPRVYLADAKAVAEAEIKREMEGREQ